MQTSLLQDELERMNRRISAEIQRFQNGSGMDLDLLLAQLRQAEQCLAPSSSQQPAEASGLLEFRTNLQQLAVLLPAVHERLLIDRARLERARTHLNGAVAWANSNKKSL
jgi:hypothetical protein